MKAMANMADVNPIEHMLSCIKNALANMSQHIMEQAVGCGNKGLNPMGIGLRIGK
jgi:hypothetical protein